MGVSNKRVIVTGATGIAGATSSKLVAAGARVFVISLRSSELESLGAEVDLAGTFAADLTDESQAEEAFAAAVATLGGVDGLFAVAGGSGRRFGDGPIHEMTLEAWEKTQELNGNPMFLAAREATRNMSEGGSIVLTGSVLAARPVPRHFATHAYAAVKGAATAFATALAAQYAPAGIRVNVIAPGLVDTPMAERAAGSPEIVEYATRKQPLAGGLLDADAIADAALFLLSEESRQITGQVLAVDGGWSVTEA